MKHWIDLLNLRNGKDPIVLVWIPDTIKTFRNAWSCRDRSRRSSQGSEGLSTRRSQWTHITFWTTIIKTIISFGKIERILEEKSINNSRWCTTTIRFYCDLNQPQSPRLKSKMLTNNTVYSTNSVEMTLLESIPRCISRSVRGIISQGIHTDDKYLSFPYIWIGYSCNYM